MRGLAPALFKLFSLDPESGVVVAVCFVVSMVCLWIAYDQVAPTIKPGMLLQLCQNFKAGVVAFAEGFGFIRRRRK